MNLFEFVNKVGAARFALILALLLSFFYVFKLTEPVPNYDCMVNSTTQQQYNCSLLYDAASDVPPHSVPLVLVFFQVTCVGLLVYNFMRLEGEGLDGNLAFKLVKKEVMDRKAGGAKPISKQTSPHQPY